MNSSVTNGNLSSVNNNDRLYAVLLTFDHVFRYYSVIVHLVFILVLFQSSEIQTRSRLYVNHATVVSIFYPIVLFLYIFGNSPNFASPSLNATLCVVSAYFREFSAFIRLFSILIIAIYRYIAVFHLELLQRVNSSYKLLLAPIAFIWLLSLATPLVINTALQTTVNRMLCLNGQSESTAVSVSYFVISYLIMIIAPGVMTVLIYAKIMVELKRVRFRVKPCSKSKQCGPVTIHVTPSSGVMIDDPTSKQRVSDSLVVMDQKKEKIFALHFILLCTSVVLTSLVFSVFYQNRILPNYFIVLYYWLPILRVLISIGVSLVPITTLYFHPSRPRFVAHLRKRFASIRIQSFLDYD